MGDVARAQTAAPWRLRRNTIRQTYARAGVNIARKTEVIDRIRQLAGATLGPQVLGGVGFFGGLYEFKGRRDAVLVSSIDSVGSKTRVAIALGKYDTIGADIVNHCINDILTCGARPLFLLDYIGTGKVVPERVADIVGGVAGACRESGCALIGGETAEIPGVYRGDDFDLAACIIGVVRKNKIIMGKDIAPGDLVIGLPSTGLHTNAYSLVRKIFGETREVLSVRYPGLGETLGQALLKPHRSYFRMLEPVLPKLKGIAHITGGGVIGNVSRILPKGLAAELESEMWAAPPIFGLIQKKGNMSLREMYRVFNMGLGMVVVCSPRGAAAVIDAVPEAHLVGRVIEQARRERVVIDGVGYHSDKVKE